MVRVPTHRVPVHRGEMLIAEFLKSMGPTRRDLADGIRVPCQRVNEFGDLGRQIANSVTGYSFPIFQPTLSAEFFLEKLGKE